MNSIKSISYTNSLKYSKGKFDLIFNYFETLTLKNRIIYIIIPFILTYIFTLLYFNISLSIIYALLTFVLLMLYSKIIALIFLILYIVVVVDKNKKVNNYIGIPFLETNIYKNNQPLNCKNNPLIIDKKNILQNTNNGHFTYSFWLYVNGTNNDLSGDNWNSYRYGEWKSIFYRGTSINSDDLSKLVQFPGFWLTPKLNNLVIVFQNSSEVERIEINNIEFNKWLNIVVVFEIKSVNIYINGKLDRVLNLSQYVSNMDQYNLYISNDKNASPTQQSGFAGSISELIYYNYALTNINVNKSYEYYKDIINKYQNNYISNNYSFNNIKLLNNNDRL
jgi:hypothetical protein